MTQDTNDNLKIPPASGGHKILRPLRPMLLPDVRDRHGHSHPGPSFFFEKQFHSSYSLHGEKTRFQVGPEAAASPVIIVTLGRGLGCQ